MAILPASKTTRARTSKPRFARIQKIRLKTLLALCLWLKLKKMKSKIFKLYPVVLLFLFMGASCQNDDIEYADESIEISSYPGMSIYKSKSSYKDKLTVCLDAEGNITCTPLFGFDKNIVSKNKNGDFVLIRRHFLKSGYVLEDVYLDYAFTDITVNEMVETFSEFGAEYWSHERYSERIIDRDPFIEFYHSNVTGRPEVITIGEINDMIENGTLDNFFTKLK